MNYHLIIPRWVSQSGYRGHLLSCATKRAHFDTAESSSDPQPLIEEVVIEPMRERCKTKQSPYLAAPGYYNLLLKRSTLMFWVPLLFNYNFANISLDLVTRFHFFQPCVHTFVMLQLGVW